MLFLWPRLPENACFHEAEILISKQPKRITPASAGELPPFYTGGKSFAMARCRIRSNILQIQHTYIIIFLGKHSTHNKGYLKFQVAFFR